jgi:uncharacterized SAM-binding protein YcdF (DUF218 family)
MLYVVTKALIMPPGGLILLFLIGFLLVRGVLGRLFIFVGLTVLTLMSLPTVAGKLIASLEPYPALEPAALLETGADAILILAGDRYSWAPELGGDTVGSKTLQRLRYGAFLHRQTGLPVYVTGGSPPHEDPPLGQLMVRVMEGEYGIAVAGVEDRSQNTGENAEFSAAMLARDGVRRALLVTHAWHMPRAVDAFERAGVDVIPAPTAFAHREGSGEPDYRDWLPSAGAFLVSYFALHEWLGNAWYQLKATLATETAESDPA